MTADEFKQQMTELIAKHRGDTEAQHVEIDELTWGLLRVLGYGDGIDLINDLILWYA